MISLYPHFKKLQVARKRKSALLHKQRGAFPWWKCLDYRKVSIEKRCYPCLVLIIGEYSEHSSPFTNFLQTKKHQHFCWRSSAICLTGAIIGEFSNISSPFANFFAKKKTSIAAGLSFEVYLFGGCNGQIHLAYGCVIIIGEYSRIASSTAKFLKKKNALLNARRFL